MVLDEIMFHAIHFGFSYFEFEIRLIKLGISFQQKSLCSCIRTHNQPILRQES